MAFFDNPLLLSNSQSITTTAASSVVYDVFGVGSGNAPPMSLGSNGFPGVDIGTGDGTAIPHAYFSIITTGTGSGTITFQVQAAPVTSSGSNTVGTYVTLAASQAFVGSTLIAGDVIDLIIPPYASAAAQIGPAMNLPRFYRFNYVVSGTATATVTAAILISPPLSYVSTQVGNNFTAA